MRHFLFSRAGLVMLGFLAVGGYFLWTEHQVHTIAALPWLLVGGCLLMHLFMHGGHGGYGSGGDTDPGDDEPEDDNECIP